MQWDQIRLFLAIIRGGSLAAAGARLEMLEEDLGVTRFDRTRDGTRPTQLAEELLADAEQIELGVTRFAAVGERVETRVEGTVRITVPPGISDIFVAPHLRELHRRH